MKKVTLLVVALLIGNAAVTQITFEKVITVGALEKILSVIQTSDGGYAMVVLSQTTSPRNDLLLVKTDSFGDTAWTKTFYGGDQHTGDRALVQTSSGGFTFICNRNDKANLMHTTATGDSVWEKELSSRNCFSLAPTTGHGYIATGYGTRFPGSR
ncbi:MAG: hypothetical protein Q8M08_13445 [Bacteroidales bacterium]|nr:hypothetical protein [Bacteroidales bacterium]